MSERARLQGMAVAWFRQEDWSLWCEIDPLFQPDYNHWLRRMEAAIVQLQASGTPFVKVVIDPDEFVAWGKANGKGVGTMDRAHYATLKAMQADGQGPLA